MNKNTAFGILLLAFAAGCGSSRSSSNQASPDATASTTDTANVPVSDPGGSSGSTTASNSSSSAVVGAPAPATPLTELVGTDGIYVRGVNNSTFTSLPMVIESVSVTVDGVAIPVDTTQQQVAELAIETSWRVGSMPEVPAGKTAIVTITFKGVGQWSDGIHSGSVLNVSLPMDFQAIGDALALRHHVVAHIDVNRSFVTCDGEMHFLPQYGIHY